MKIGVIGSGNDMLTLFKILQKYDHEYIVYYDDLLWPYGDKPAAVVQSVIADGMEILRARGCEQLILPPVSEIAFREQQDVMPLFQTYLMDYAFQYSLVGQIGLIGDRSDIQVAQPLLTTFAKTYTPTDHQKSIKKFHTPFARWVKEAPLWKYFLTVLSYSAPMVNRVIKVDLHYFKDANVDTLIPLNYGYFNYQNTISKFLNFKKCRFHKLDKLEECFKKVYKGSVPPDKEGGPLAVGGLEGENIYSVKILYTGQKELLERNKKIMRMLQRGKGIEVEFEKV